jgi:hypothetical protein
MNMEMNTFQLLARTGELLDKTAKGCKIKTHARCEKDKQKVKNTLHSGQKNDTI